MGASLSVRTVRSQDRRTPASKGTTVHPRPGVRPAPLSPTCPGFRVSVVLGALGTGKGAEGGQHPERGVRRGFCPDSAKVGATPPSSRGAGPSGRMSRGPRRQRSFPRGLTPEVLSLLLVYGQVPLGHGLFTLPPRCLLNTEHDRDLPVPPSRQRALVRSGSGCRPQDCFACPAVTEGGARALGCLEGRRNACIFRGF